ncbi:MAG: ClpXP protease specificity-enhancing factor [Ferrovum sp.]|nr:ClpXP protease specificity-enhancing factor [Ferrovum sp.]NDU87579.1 ClpXP protease specificity-enhancing factor [Ferrovum sp.]
MTRSTKPYLARALWEWCEDNSLTPLLHVLVEGTEARVPQAFVKEGQIILNVSATATRHLSMDNGGIEFSARFNGVAEQVQVPWKAVLGLFARETGEGMAFPSDEQEWAEDGGKSGTNAPALSRGSSPTALDRMQDTAEMAEAPVLVSVKKTTSEAVPDAKSATKKPTLTVIK